MSPRRRKERRRKKRRKKRRRRVYWELFLMLFKQGLSLLFPCLHQ